MPSNSVATQKLDVSAPLGMPAPALARAFWWQVCLNIAYVLLAGPRGAAYLLVFMIGLALDLPLLMLRLLLVASLGLLYLAARAVWWLLRFGLRFLWVSLVVIIGAVLHVVWWLLLVVGSAVGRFVFSVLVYGIQRREADSTRAERVRIRLPRPANPARLWAGHASRVWRGERFLDAVAAGLKQLWKQIVLGRWIAVPVIWWRLAL